MKAQAAFAVVYGGKGQVGDPGAGPVCRGKGEEVPLAALYARREKSTFRSSSREIAWWKS